MKEKRGNLKSTLNKKVQLQNVSKSVESINKHLSEIHPYSGEKGKEIVRTTIHLPRDIHTKIKVYCVNNSLSFKDYVTEKLIESLDVY